MASLDSVIKDLNKKFKFDMINEGIKFEEIKRIPFSSPRMNHMTYGGLPMGRLVEFAGAEGGGKTTTALDIVANAQKLFPDKKVCYVDVERTLDGDWAKLLGVDVENLILVSPGEEMSAEQIFEVCKSVVETGEISVCVLDSLGAMVSAQAYSKTIEDRTYGGISVALTLFSKQMIPICARTGCLFIGINQMREDMNSMYGNTITTGGKAWKHNCSIRLQFKKGDYIDEKGTVISRSAESPAGHHVSASLVKSKVCKMDRKIGFYILKYLYGIDVSAEVVDVGINNGMIIAAGAWFTVIDKETGEIMNDGEKDLRFQGRPRLKDYLDEHEELKEAILNG